MTKDNIIEAKNIEIKFLEDHIKEQNKAIKDLNEVINYYANKKNNVGGGERERHTAR